MTSIVTNTGKAKISAALANEAPLDISHIAVGTSDRVPNGGETELDAEIYRDLISEQGIVAGTNKAYFRMTVPEDGNEPGKNYGPWTAQEYGLFDADGDLIAIGRLAQPYPKYDPAGAELNAIDIQIDIIFDNLAAINLTYVPETNLPWANQAQFDDPNTTGRIPEVSQIHALVDAAIDALGDLEHPDVETDETIKGDARDPENPLTVRVATTDVSGIGTLAPVPVADGDPNDLVTVAGLGDALGSLALETDATIEGDGFDDADPLTVRVATEQVTGISKLAPVPVSGGGDDDVVTVAGLADALGDLSNLSPVIIVHQRRASTIDPYDIPSDGAWYKRPYNTLLANQIPGASVDFADRTITLPAGIYRVGAATSAFNASAYHTRIYDLTNSVMLELGTTIDSNAGDNDVSATSMINGRFTITAPATIALEEAVLGGGAKSGEIDPATSPIILDAYIVLTREKSL